jgi:hypothetical protein
MMTETVRENFGEPVATSTVWDPPGAPGGWDFLRGIWTYDAESSLTYVHEERTKIFGAFAFSSFFLPFQIVATAVGSFGTLVSGGHDFQWDWAYVERKPVVLYFGQEKLARWEVIVPEHVPAMSSGYYDPWVTERGYDLFHHSVGHTHHHGLDHDC